MAATVLSGTGNVTYTNSTGQNVRVVINYMEGPQDSSYGWNMSWGGVTIGTNLSAIGRNLAVVNYLSGSGSLTLQNAFATVFRNGVVPTEIMLAPGQTFSTTKSNPSYPLGAYNIVVIPEAG